MPVDRGLMRRCTTGAQLSPAGQLPRCRELPSCPQFRSSCTPPSPSPLPCYCQVSYENHMQAYDGTVCPCCLGKGRVKRYQGNLISALLSFDP